jgi:hypothetical protein
VFISTDYSIENQSGQLTTAPEVYFTQIIEQGTHDQLMAQGGHYAELYNTYFRHQSLEYIESFVS